MEMDTTLKAKTISDIKAAARGSLFGHSLSIAGITLLYASLHFIVSGIVSFAENNRSILSMVVYYILGILAFSLIETLRYGLSYIFLKNSCHQPFQVSDIFQAYKNGGIRIYPAALVMASLSFIPILPTDIYLYLTSHQLPAAKPNMLLAAIFWLAGYLVYYLVYLGFSMTYYVLNDFPNMGSLDAMKMSFWLTKGYRWKYLLMNLSILPLYLFGILSCGVGSLFVYPYQFSACACFYLNLTSVKAGK